MAGRPTVSIVVCARNEAARLPACLAGVLALGADEIVVVDGGSTDGTADIAAAAGVRVIRSGGKGLAFDRQLGAMSATGELIAMIDADHRPQPDLLDRMWEDMQHFGFAVVQTGVDIVPDAFWTRAEADAMAVFHHRPGPRKMIGVAPALYRRDVFETVGFDVGGQEVSDDADFCYRLAQTGATFGVGRVRVMQKHEPALSDYVAKFAWYGRRDAGFCLKHPERARAMFFHLAVRYPLLRPLAAIKAGKPRAIAWFWLASAVRLSAAVGAMRRAAQRDLMGVAA